MKIAAITLMVLVWGWCVLPSKGEDAPASRVSSYQLVAKPDEFLGHRLITQGYLKSRGRDLWLFPTKEDADSDNTAAAVWLKFSQEVRDKLGQVAGGRVEATGTFGKSEKPKAFKVGYYFMEIDSLHDLRVLSSPTVAERDSAFRQLGVVEGKLEILEAIKEGKNSESIDDLKRELEIRAINLLRICLSESCGD